MSKAALKAKRPTKAHGSKALYRAVRGKLKRKPAPSPAELQGPSPNPHTNLAIADIAIIGGSMLARHMIERAMLGRNYSPEKTKAILKGRSVGEAMLHGAMARLATGSIPGALLVGSGLIVKTLYDRTRTSKAHDKGVKKMDRMARKGAHKAILP